MPEMLHVKERVSLNELKEQFARAGENLVYVYPKNDADILVFNQFHQILKLTNMAGAVPSGFGSQKIFLIAVSPDLSKKFPERPNLKNCFVCFAP